ncbi:uncharacterized protein LOC128683555 [Plodia interpunctella]|uniref:uncharacterized protein LOC128683555 n=1 Tax=Plodia interpunctella TaxID=58824 RepID=UPI0023675DD5|nr:uncharacterized protein LOC128683555 [Plodia interpunctella]XP_053625270.1 uncharacterized protein LOC128683555 [Plodia interpunctella]XP_053625271.1 uncharacterized protein LOC128683555 [Plodia interpunctella]XP_053625272.1 uncharacterized protein LOC128683555 [Plodia interpunctella]
MKNIMKMITISRSKSVTSAVLALWLVLPLFYYNILNILPRYKFSILERKGTPKFMKQFKDDFNESGEFLLNTPGCLIPNYGRTIIFKPAKIYKKNCAQRGVFINTVSDDEIQFVINNDVLNKYRKNKNDINCCYEFVSRPNSKIPGVNDTQVEYSKCVPFKNGAITKLVNEVINVKCVSGNSTNAFYKDGYIVLKKVQRKETKEPQDKWNVLILGMDTMSRARARFSLPRTMEYLKNSGWLDFKGYQKVGENTYPNIMAILSGNAKLYCGSSMDKCNDRLIWNKFRSAGYVTAYAEDYLNLPDTFRNYGGFEVPPTDHYMRPFFLLGEYTTGNKVCTQKMSSAIHILNYALQLTLAYDKSNFFGLFWMNSYSHNQINNPTLIDSQISEFLKVTNKKNTFIFFISDHGIRFGESRYSVESFYEERLPMFYMWVPLEFRERYPDEFYNMQVNQNRLVTTYDLHETLWEILKISDDTVAINKSTVCPQCTSIFEEKSINRTCMDAVIAEKWCSCHNLVPINKESKTAHKIIEAALDGVQNVSNSVKTRKCSACAKLEVKNVLRVHEYYNGDTNKTHYVVAFLLTPGEMGYEVIVDNETSGYRVTSPLSTITSYNKKGDCVLNHAHRGLCVCVNTHCR